MIHLYYLLNHHVDAVGSQDSSMNRRAIDKAKDGIEIRSNESNVDTSDATTVAKSEIDGTMEQLKPKKSNIKFPVLPPRANVNQAMTLQIEANNLLKHIISQNNKQIQLL